MLSAWVTVRPMWLRKMSPTSKSSKNRPTQPSCTAMSPPPGASGYHGRTPGLDARRDQTTMARVNGATLLARTLRQAGSGPVFTLSGHQILPVYDAGIDAELRFVDTRHENAAVHMADGWGRLTGQVGVALVTAAPGHTNALTGVATALNSESPVLLISGGAEVPNLGRGGFQEMDQLTMIGPICKGAWMPKTAEEIPGFVARAYRVALSGVPGPVHLTVPYDVLHQSVDEDAVALLPAADFERVPQAATDVQIERLLSMLAEAKRPL